MKNKNGIIGAVICSLIIFCGCSREQADGPARISAVHVEAGRVLKKDMPLEISAIGAVEAFSSVTIMPQVSAQIQSIHFSEGQNIRKGQLIYRLNPANFQEELRQTQAKLSRDRAQWETDKVEAARYQFLVEKGAVSKSDYDKYRTTAATQGEIVQESRAAVDKARLKLSYCDIRSPLAGRAGSYLVNQGAIVTENQTNLVIIHQMKPIYTRFSVAEKYLPSIKSAMQKGPIPVFAGISGQEQNKITGKLAFIDNAVDAETGMIKMKAVFPNTDGSLWPGQFVNVRLQLSVQKDAVVAPAAAVQMSQDGPYVFVVKPDKTVMRTLVKVDRTMGNETIISGMDAGATVVTDGQLKLRDGFKVEYDAPAAKK
jgi:membrane fusion protein, multidrug efflux system